MADAVATSKNESADGPSPPDLRWYRAAAIGFALVFVIFAAWSWWNVRFWPKGADFVSFWAAGRLALAGHSSLAYDIAAHHAAEQAVGHVGGLLPFPYPPPFLAIVTVFALLPFGPAFYLWTITTASFYGWAARRVAPFAYVFAMPPAYINLLIGQTGFLMSGIFVSGVTLIEDSPLMAGAILGLMVLKPQLALLLPVAMFAGREWSVIVVALLSASAMLLFGLLLFGWSTYQSFFEILPHYIGFMRDGRLPWNEVASPFALGRFVGLSQTAALSIHFLAATIATLLAARAWWFKLDQRVPILAAATLLIPPYLLTYDALLLIVPAGWMIRHRHPYSLALIWLCCLIPVTSFYTPWIAPNLISIGAAISLWILHSDLRARRARWGLERATKEAS
jgi:hypothetical protein